MHACVRTCMRACMCISMGVHVCVFINRFSVYSVISLCMYCHFEKGNITGCDIYIQMTNEDVN